MDKAALAIAIVALVFASGSWVAHMVEFFHLGKRPKGKT
jgi:hypothetical protein